MVDVDLWVEDDPEPLVPHFLDGDQVVEAVLDPLVEVVYFCEGVPPEGHVAPRGEFSEVEACSHLAPLEAGLHVEEGLVHVDGEKILLVVALHVTPDEAHHGTPEVPGDGPHPVRGDDAVPVGVGDDLPCAPFDAGVPRGVEALPLLVHEEDGVLLHDLPGARSRRPPPRSLASRDRIRGP